VYRAAPEFITLEIKRNDVLRWLKEVESYSESVESVAAMHGIFAFKKTVVSSR